MCYSPIASEWGGQRRRQVDGSAVAGLNLHPGEWGSRFSTTSGSFSIDPVAHVHHGVPARCAGWRSCSSSPGTRSPPSMPLAFCGKIGPPTKIRPLSVPKNVQVLYQRLLPGEAQVVLRHVRAVIEHPDSAANRRQYCQRHQARIRHAGRTARRNRESARGRAALSRHGHAVRRVAGPRRNGPDQSDRQNRSPDGNPRAGCSPAGLYQLHRASRIVAADIKLDSSFEHVDRLQQ